MNRCSDGFSLAARSCKGNDNQVMAYQPFSNPRSCNACEDYKSELLQRIRRIYVGEVQSKAEREGWSPSDIIVYLQEKMHHERIEDFDDLVTLDRLEDRERTHPVISRMLIDGYGSDANCKKDGEETRAIAMVSDSKDRIHSPPMTANSSWLEWRDQSPNLDDSDEDDDDGSSRISADSCPPWASFRISFSNQGRQEAFDDRMDVEPSDPEADFMDVCDSLVDDKTDIADSQDVDDMGVCAMDLCDGSEANDEASDDGTEAEIHDDSNASEADIEDNLSEAASEDHYNQEEDDDEQPLDSSEAELDNYS